MDLVFLHGGAAAGKLTVARALNERVHFGVFHNHLIVDALTAVFTFGTPSFVKLREEFWLATFREAALSDTSLIFTFAPEASVMPGFADRARAAVEDAGGRIRFVRLEVSGEEQERRIQLASRREFGKLADVETLRRLRAEDAHAEQPPSDLIIDTDEVSAEQAADLIVRALELQPVQEHPRYPTDQPS